MKSWIYFDGFKFNILGKKNKYIDTIFTFDIETTSIYELDSKIYPAINYKDLNQKEKDRSSFYGFMYIWQLGINDKVYYGRTWDELKDFLKILDEYTGHNKKYFFIHNLSFEFQFLKGVFEFEKVTARNVRHVMTCQFKDYNIECHCTYTMSNVSLKKLAEVYHLPVKKKSGDLDYSKIRIFTSPLSEIELQYCEYDCLVVYYYILFELETYKELSKIPITYTGHVRKEFRNLISKDYQYKYTVKKAINTNPHIYNLLVQAFMGGYTHSNAYFSNRIIYDVDSYDFTSSYPYVMVSEKYPGGEFKKDNIKKVEDMLSNFAYILVVRFKNIKSRYYNNFISFSKCREIRGGHYDNGRIVSADSLEITLTDIDFKFLLKAYTGTYEILESYSTYYRYLPIQYINFILEKYESKTKLKNVEGREIEYALSKNSFNSLYGMTVTNTIRDTVVYDNLKGWYVTPLTNNEILCKLSEDKAQGFLSFAYGVWVTAYARRNLLENALALDDWSIYFDTDSIKVAPGYDKKIIENYNKKVIDKLKKVSKDLGISFNKFSPTDIKGNNHTLGLFEKEYTSKTEKEYTYKEFKTLGAKKYAYRTMDGVIQTTVSGVPKAGAKSLKNDLNNFTDNLVFKYEDTGKNTLLYNDFQESIIVTDYLGNTEKINEPSGASMLPTTYVLKNSVEMSLLEIPETSERSIYKE